MKKEHIFFSIIIIFFSIFTSHASEKTKGSGLALTNISFGLGFGAGLATVNRLYMDGIDHAAVASLCCSASAHCIWLAYQSYSLSNLRDNIDAQRRAISDLFNGLNAQTILRAAVAGSLMPVAYKAQCEPDTIQPQDFILPALGTAALLSVKYAKIFSACIARKRIKDIESDL